jgi:hypothetical protein
MTSLPKPESPGRRPFHLRRWRTIAAGAVVASIGFVAAQAGSLGLLQVELAKLAKVVDDKPIVAQTSQGPHRSYSDSSGDHPTAPSFGAAGRSGMIAATPGQPLKFEASDTQAAGEATTDAGLFALAPAATSMRFGGSQQPLQIGGRFHGLVFGGGQPAARPANGGSGRKAAQRELADCCADPATDDQSDPLLTAPVLSDVISGPVPEPIAWTMMILGLGLSGMVLRRQQRRWA